MTATATSRDYTAQFILDTRGYDQPIETLHAEVQKILEDNGVTVNGLTDLGRKDFVRITERNHTGDFWPEYSISCDAPTADKLQDAFRLVKTVKRLLVLSA